MIEWLLYVLFYLQGVCLGYIIWAPMTAFKEGFQEVLTLGIWKRKK